MASSEEGSSTRSPRGNGSRGSRAAPEPAAAIISRSFPHSIEAEEGLLACCLLNPEIIDRCVEAHLTGESFYKPSHQLVFDAAAEVYRGKSAVDEIILAEELKSRGKLDEIGGLPFINQLTNRVDTTAHAAHFLAIVREKHLLRRLIRTSTASIERCYSHQGELDRLLEDVEREIFEISQQRSLETARPLRESVREAYSLIQKLIEKKGELSGISTGYIDLDKITYGFHPSEMIVLAARPSMGKTSLALNFAEHVIMPRAGLSPTPTLVFSLEMSAEQLAMRMLCARARVSMVRLRDGFSSTEERQRLVAAADELSKAPLWIDDSGNLNMLEVRAKSRRLHAKHALGLIIIDYLQLLSGTDSSVQREQQIAEISRGLKAMAKELNLPVIVISQLNRESERERRQPRLSDLRESGAIEQDADVVLMLARPKDASDEFSVVTDRADLIVAKQRNGPVGTINLTFLREITRFENFSGHHSEE